jgi:hypothetical protein
VFPRSISRPRTLWLAAFLAAAFAPSCDNPACVFGGTCSDDDLASGPEAAAPADHAWVQTGAPKLEAAFPSGSGRANTTPIVLRFSESISTKNLTGAFQLVQQGGTGFPVPLLPPVLAGDGRFLILVPNQALLAGATYTLARAQGKQVVDLEGQALAVDEGETLLTFSVAQTNPNLPAVVASWPPDNGSNASATGEIVVVFDRKLNPATVTSDSFDVTVGGAQPAFDPPATPMTVLVAGTLPTPDTRAYLWRSVDGDGLAVPLGLGASVKVELSPPGDKILSESGQLLAAIEIDFDLLAFPAPAEALLVSHPDDAIGIANLDGTLPLAVDVDLGSVLATDRLDMFLFGQSKSSDQGTGTQPKLVSLFRSREVADLNYDAGTGIARLGEGDLNLANSSAPVSSFFGDGELRVAFRLRRGNAGTPVRLLDGDPDSKGSQSVLLDVTRPKLLAFSSSGTNLQSYRSDLPDLCLVGRASEQLRAVEVSTALGDNGALAPVAASDAATFVAAPVPLGVLDPAQQPLNFTVRIYDRALNASAADTTGRFKQVGLVGPGSSLPGSATVAVDVFDARTLSPISGAEVFVHENSGGPLSLVDVQLTNSSGFAAPLAAPAGATLVTVQASGYATFHFQALPVARVSIPLVRTNQAPLFSAGVLSSSDSDVSAFQRNVVDTRALPADEFGFAVASCGANSVTQQFECAFGPRPALTRVGAISGLVTDPPPSEFGYTAAGFLRDLAFVAPFALPASGALPPALVPMGSLLDDLDTPTEEQALDGPQLLLDASSTTGIALGQLNGGPRVLVQARGRSLHGGPTVGAGLAFPQSGSPTDVWKLRCALAGIADPTDGKYPGDEIGELVQQGVIEADLRLRVELRDALGNRSGRRPRFSSLGGFLAPLSVPTLLAPPPGGSAGGSEFDLVFPDVLNGLGAQGFYRVTLTDDLGRIWTLLRPSGAGATQSVRVPDLAPAGGLALSSGPISCTIEARAWPGVDPARFSLSDLEREYDHFAATGVLAFTLP